MYRIEKSWKYKGYDCAVIFQLGGYRCGYVNVPKGHKCYKVDYPNIDILVHGGLTYSSSELVGHKKGWWIGFDCNHFYDGYDWESAKELFKDSPEALERIKFHEEYDDTSIFGGFRNSFVSLSDCVSECQNMVDQLIKKDKWIFDNRDNRAHRG